MMIGSYPCCEGPLFIAMPERRLPLYAPENCPHCGAKVWHLFSKAVPTTWVEADFLAEHNIDPVTKTITRKDGRDCYGNPITTTQTTIH